MSTPNSPTSIHHGLSVLSDADPSQRLAHPLPDTEVKHYDVVTYVTKYIDGRIDGSSEPESKKLGPRQVFNIFNDATTRWGYLWKPLQYPEGHPGIDYLCTVGHDVTAMYGGIVTYADLDSSGSNTVTIRSWTKWNSTEAGRLGFDIIYGHLDSYSVAEGDVVKKGQLIGVSGKTGHYEIPHLHVGLKAFDGDGMTTAETIRLPSNSPFNIYIAPLSQRIKGFMNFACFLPADADADGNEIPAITQARLAVPASPFDPPKRKLLSIRTAYPFNPEELLSEDFVPLFTTYGLDTF